VYRHQLLTTTLGDLDCLGTIDRDRGYEELLPVLRATLDETKGRP
jgi:hypothetical protein